MHRAIQFCILLTFFPVVLGAPKRKPHAFSYSRKNTKWSCYLARKSSRPIRSHSVEVDSDVSKPDGRRQSQRNLTNRARRFAIHIPMNEPRDGLCGGTPGICALKMVLERYPPKLRTWVRFPSPLHKFAKFTLIRLPLLTSHPPICASWTAVLRPSFKPCRWRRMAMLGLRGRYVTLVDERGFEPWASSLRRR
jgi:hypothetical protein